ncbi:MAG TPA: hypothetical protein DCM87_15030 [Planctomycetes bacterium]|nr:hypothetical protein [Planctomycetota bacterium]
MRLTCLVLALALCPAGAAEKTLAALKQDLRKALASGDARLLGQACAALRTLGGSEAAGVLLEQVEKAPAQSETYWLLIDGAASFGDESALTAVGRFVVERGKSPAARDVLFALERNRLSTKSAALIPIMDECAGELALGAVRQLGEVRVPEVVDALIARLARTKDSDGELRRYLAGALANITGEHFGTSIVNWEGWWKGHRGRELTGRKARERTTGTARDEVDAIRDEQIIGIEKLSPRRIVVIKGKCVDWERFDHNFDHIEHMLEQMDFPHTVITKEDFEAGFALAESMVVCINCMMWRPHCVCPDCKPGEDAGNRLHRCTGCNRHDVREYKFSGAAVERLKRFVEAGGFLFTEDWVLEELLERAWPELVGSGPKLPEKNVKALPAPGKAGHRYLEGVFRPPQDIVVTGKHRPKGRTVVRPPEEDVRAYFSRAAHTWKIDNESPAIVVKKKSEVELLLTSPDLARIARGNDALAVTFRPGKGPRKGAVLHILSHFGKQTSQDSEYGIQNMLLGFLIDANAQRGRVLPPARKGPEAEEKGTKEEPEEAPEEAPEEEPEEEPEE